MASEESNDGSRFEDIFVPRRGLRKKKMSLKAIEHAAINNESSDENEFTKSGTLRVKRGSPEKTRSLPDKNKETKTPRTLRTRLKKGIANKIQELSDEEEDIFSTDEFSDYLVSESSDYSSESEKSNNTSSSANEKPLLNLVVKKNKPTHERRVPSLVKHVDNREYTISYEDYFTNHSSKKILTSNHTLDKLKMPRLPQHEVQKLLSKASMSKEHEIAVNNLLATHESCFTKWLYLLQENYNVLLYGLGSKRSILHKFHEECLYNESVVVVNGFFPKLSIKDVVDAIICDVLCLKDNPTNIFDGCELIKKKFYNSEGRLYIIVHNIDGDMLQNNKSQTILSLLASFDNVHLVASTDRANSPLIWNYYKLSKFNFIWWDATCFLPYSSETAFESSMMVQKTGTLALSALRNVFLSLTANSKGIYNIIVKHQLENSNQYYQGLLFKDLYLLCREAFLVSSDLALRAQLNEFVDHKMVKYKRSVDGNESLIIPISNTLLQQFLDEQS